MSEAGQQEGFLEEETLEWRRRGEGGPGWAWPATECRGEWAGGLWEEQKQRGRDGKRSVSSPELLRRSLGQGHGPRSAYEGAEAQVSR